MCLVRFEYAKFLYPPPIMCFATNTNGQIVLHTFLNQYLRNKDSTSFTLPNDVYEIYNNAFDSTNIKEITLNNVIVKIGKEAFNNTQIENIFIPDSLMQINSNAFINTRLKTVKATSNNNISLQASTSTTFYGATNVKILIDKITSINTNNYNRITTAINKKIDLIIGDINSVIEEINKIINEERNIERFFDGFNANVHKI